MVWQAASSHRLMARYILLIRTIIRSAIYHDGTLYVADQMNNRIRKISTNGVVSNLAGSVRGFKDGNTSDSLFFHPSAITISHNDTLYVVDDLNNRIRKILPNESYSTIKILLYDNKCCDMDF